MMWIYKVTQMPHKGEGRLAWIGIFGAQLWLNILSPNLLQKPKK